MNTYLWNLRKHLQHLLRCLSQPPEAFAEITAVIEMGCEDPKPAVFAVVTPIVLPINPLTWEGWIDGWIDSR